MGAKVQSKTYFAGSMTDLNNGFRNGIWDLFHDDKTHKIGNNQHYDYYLTMQTMDGYTGYAKEQIKQTILNHESIFRHQLEELHRLYKKQRDLMNPVPAETSKLNHFLNQAPSDVSNQPHCFASSFPPVDSNFGSIKGKTTLGVSEKTVIDLELPADEDNSNDGKQNSQNFHSLRSKRVFDLADLNEPIQVEETDFSASVGNKNSTGCRAEELQKRDSSAKRTLFGVEICELNHTPTFHSSSRQSRTIESDSSFVLPWRNPNSSGQNASTLYHNHWLGSSDSTRQNLGFFAGNFRSGVGFHKNSMDSVSDNRDEIRDREKHKFLPPWLMAKPSLHNEQIKGNESTVYHINLDSLQNHSHQFFQKTEIAEDHDTREFKKVKIDDSDSQSITKILGVPIIDLNPKIESNDSVEENGRKNCVHIDLNLALDEEDASMEIDLEGPVVLESDNSPEIQSDDGSMDTDLELVKVAAEAILSISLSPPPQQPSASTLRWFADVITTNEKSSVIVNDESVPEGMDYFEYMTLKLQETNENYSNYKPVIMEEEKEDNVASMSKRTPRKGQGRRGRQRKDFQKDILPTIVSLSRREVTEDIQIFEEAFSATGVSWQSSLSKRKSAARNGRGRRRLVVAVPSCNPAVEQAVCREVALEKSIGGWGRRTRRLPRQRCRNSGNHHSLVLKC